MESKYSIFQGEKDADTSDFLEISQKAKVLKDMNMRLEKMVNETFLGKGTILEEIYRNFMVCLSMLNEDIIIKYNSSNIKKLYTIKESFEAYKKNSKSVLLNDFL